MALNARMARFSSFHVIFAIFHLDPILMEGNLISSLNSMKKNEFFVEKMKSEKKGHFEERMNTYQI